MNVLHVNTKYYGGGAARAMGRLHNALITKGHQSKFLIGREEHTERPEVYRLSEVVKPYKRIWESLFSRFGNRFEKLWGIHPLAYRPGLHLPETNLFEWADILDLRNLFGNYFNLWVLPELTKQKAVVWRLPDMWALTGHCAYPYNCERWIDGCHDCPLLTGEDRKLVEPPPTQWDGTRRSWKAKRRIYQKSDIHIVVTTEWMKKNVKKGILNDALSVNVVSNGVNLDLFRPRNPIKARKELDLPSNRAILLFAAAHLGNLRKGYRYTEKALRYLHDWRDEPPLLITMGNPQGTDQNISSDYVRHLGFIKDPKMQALIYSAADLFLCSTLADAQPQTALESLACGTPIIAFDVGPMTEIVQEELTGFISPQLSSLALAKTIQKALQTPGISQQLRQNCRAQAEVEYDLDNQTNQYISLYQQVLDRE